MDHWKRTLTVTALAQTFSIMGFSFVVPFLPLYLQRLGIHGTAQVTFWAALLYGGSALSMAIAAPIWGVLADRYGRKIMVTRSMFSAALLVGLMGLAQNVIQLLILRMLQGVFTGTVSASQALVASQAPRERLGFSMGVMQTAVFTGTSIGPLVGGLLVDAFGFRQSFAAATAIFLVGGSLIVLFVQEEERFAGQKGLPRPRVWAGVRDALKTPALPAMIATIFAVQFGTTVVFPVLPQFIQYLQGAADHAATVTGLVFAAAGLAGALSSLSVGSLSDRIGYKSVLVVASLLAAALSIPQYFVTATWQLAVLRIGTGICFGAINPAASALIATLVPPEKRGTAYGLAGSATAIGFAAGPFTAAVVVSIGGIRPVFLTAAVLLAFIAAWVGTMVHMPEEVANEDGALASAAE
jgi:DHA1 family multidrug resistance protein-like MFS transporter